MVAPQHGPSGSERRKHVRFPAADKLLGTLIAHKLPVRVRDVGVGGFSVESMQPLSTGQVEAVQLLAADDWSAIVEAKSLHCHPSVSPDGLPLFVTGYAFVPDSASADLIATIVQKVTSVRM